MKETVNALKHYERDIIGVAEIHLTGFSEAATHEGHKISYNSKESLYPNVVGCCSEKGNKRITEQLQAHFKQNNCHKNHYQTKKY